jgi:hypothetical protein
MNITTFNMLDPQFVKIYNLHACGNELVGCPSIEGIDIGVGGVNLQTDGTGNKGLLNQICDATYSVIDEINAVAVTTGTPTPGPTAAVNDTDGAGDGNVTDSPSPSASPSVSPGISPSPTANATNPGSSDACPPIYVPNTPYEASSLVIHPNDGSTGSNTIVYACKEAPFTPWCSQVGYEPGVALAWQQAWTVAGECDVDAGDDDGGDTNGTVTTVPSTVTTGSTTAPNSTTSATTQTTAVISSSSTTGTGTMTTPANGISTVIPDDVTPSPTPVVVEPSKAPAVENTDGECPSCISTRVEISILIAKQDGVTLLYFVFVSLTILILLSPFQCITTFQIHCIPAPSQFHSNTK